MKIDDYYLRDLEEDEVVPPVGVFLYGDSVYSRGCWCEGALMEEDELIIQTTIRKVKISMSGNALMINGKELPIGESIEWNNNITVNPWSYNCVRIENNGKALICDFENMGEMIYVSGENSSCLILRKGILLLLTSIIFWFVSRRKLKIKIFDKKSSYLTVLHQG